MNVWAWIVTLIAASFVASIALGAMSGALTISLMSNIPFVIGYSISNMAMILVPSGIIAAITRFVTGNTTKAMWTWTSILLLIVGVLSIGAANVNKILSS